MAGRVCNVLHTDPSSLLIRPTLHHLEWLIGEPVPDNPELILYEILPYSREDADRIIEHLCGLVRFDIAKAHDGPADAERVRQAFRLIADAANTRKALLDLHAIEGQNHEPPGLNRLKKLRGHQRQLGIAVRDWGVRTALRSALIDLGLAYRAGPRWLHYLRDRPEVLRRTIARALEAPFMQGDPGQPNAFDLALFAQEVGRAYELLTDRPFGRSKTSETRNRRGGKPTGPGVRLLSICLKPLYPGIKDHTVEWAIRRSSKIGALR